MDQPLAVLGTANMGFFTLVIIGGLAGWIAGMIMNHRHGILTNILVGIAGSWLGSRLAEVANVVVYGSIDHFLAALVGSCLVLYVWQLVHPRPPLAPNR